MTPPALPDRRSPGLLRGLLGAVHSIWWVNGTLVVLAALLVLGPVGAAVPVVRPHLPWYVLAATIAACEIWPVRLRFRRSAHAFSLTDIPVTIGLLFATGLDFVTGLAVGTATALLIARLPPIKLVFNISQYVVATGIGLVVMRAVAGAHPEFGPRVWLATFAAMALGGVLTIVLLAGAMSLADGRLSLAELREMFGLDTVVTLGNTSIALLAAIVAVAEPSALPILLVPVVLAFAGYRAYVSERERSEKVEFLYEANRTLSHSPEVADAIEGLLDRAREAFRADHAEVILFAGDDGAPVRTRLGPNGDRHSMEPVDRAAAEVLRDLLVEGPERFAAPLPAGIHPLLEGREIRHAMAAVLRGEERIVGTILLGNRVGINRGFEAEDLALFDTLAANASAALQYDRLEQAVAELQELQHRLHHQAYHDPLTGLANRAKFTERVGAALAEGGGVAVLFVDLDDFKTVNDSLGHTVGDELLCAAGRRLAGAVRGDDLVARLGGDEFAVLLGADDHAAAGAAAVEVAERMLRSFQLPVEVGGRLLAVNLSAGVATCEHSGSGTADLLRDADLAMYEAKSGGKRRYAVFTPAMREAVLRHQALKDELRVGIDREELLVEYQPLVHLASGVTTAVEALVRWQHPQHGRIPPLEFIPLAESTGLIAPLSRFVLRTACAQAVRWAAGGAPLNVQVNLSGQEVADPELADEILGVLEVTGLPAERLTLEITETVLVQDAANGSAQLHRLRDHGVKVALDDFGTGFSSLSYLRSLPLDMLKIAKEFTDGIARDEEDATFVRLIIELARMRELTVVAEGIETRAQLDVLRGLGCDLGQGYHFARPLDAEDASFLACRRRDPVGSPSGG